MKQFWEDSDFSKSIRGTFSFRIGDIYFTIKDQDVFMAQGYLLGLDSFGHIYISYTTYFDHAGYGIPHEYKVAVFDSKGALLATVPTIEDFEFIEIPRGIGRYVFIEPNSGDIYQIGIEEVKATLMVWEKIGEVQR